MDENRFLILYNLAVTFYAMKNLEQSWAYARQAIHRGSRDEVHKAHNLLGSILFAKKQYNQAIICYQRALSSKPDYVKGHNNLGIAFLQKGKAAQAEGEWLWVVKHARAGGRMQAMREGGEGAQLDYQLEVREEGGMALALHSLSDLYISQNQDAKAKRMLTKLLQIEPGDADVHYQMGRVCRNSGDMAQARLHLQEAVNRGSRYRDEAQKLLEELDAMR